MVDYHCHILPDIDECGSDLETCRAMLQEMERQKISACIATPHFYGYRRSVAEFVRRRNEAYEALVSGTSRSAPRILLGAEVALFTDLPDLPDAELRALCVDGTRMLFLEMPFSQWSDFEENAVFRLCVQRKYQVVLVHLDRYWSLQKDRRIMERILELPVYIQINADSLISLTKRKKCVELFQTERPAFLGSDCHDMSRRSPNLRRAEMILKKYLSAGRMREIEHLGYEMLALQPQM